MKTRIILLFLSITSWPLFGVSQQEIFGNVKDEDDSPIYGVKIHLEETYMGAYTDKVGYFNIKNVSNGTYVISASTDGFDLIKDTLVVNNSDVIWNVNLHRSPQMVQEMLVQSTRADRKTPTTYTNLEKKDIEKVNYGQDLPFLLRSTPSTVVTSDAGAGVGYTGIRIRGVDPTRTNVTINGIPLNDSESHGVYWVNMPDFASSVGSIQVQRGVGTSANGATAFGASINIKTDDIHRKPYGIIDNGYGSFNTWRHSIKAGTGLINDHFTMDARLSKITSDGFIDRASSDLKSFYLSGAWLGKKASIRANIFSGKEKTYQAWWGIPEAKFTGDDDALLTHFYNNYYPGGLYQTSADSANLFNSGNKTYNYYTYENEVDNYQQDHYQLFYNQQIGKSIHINITGHYTRGHGYYEQYRIDDSLSDYGLAPATTPNDTILTGNFIRRRWLDNHFYGGIFSLNYNKNGLNLTLGGGANNYEGAHYGEIIWAEFASNSEIRDRYYNNSAYKLEAQGYLKGTYQLKKIVLYADLQFRHIQYSFLGVDEVSGVLQEVDQSVNYTFFNPKAGLMYDFNNRNNVYASVAIANREPVRADFRENTPENRPKHEQLLNIEAGYRYSGNKLFTNANMYYMDYTDQLVLTGQINDVGGYTRTNVDKSYRAGIELELGYQIIKSLSITGNITLSQNKIVAFDEYVDNYDVWAQDTISHTNTDLAFSPNIISSLGLLYSPVKGLEIGLTGKYVGDQFLDNTSTDGRKLNAYFVSNLQLSYTLRDVLFSEITFGIQVNNLFDTHYANNGYTWGYVWGGQRIVENFYYPQAGRNLMARLTIKF